MLSSCHLPLILRASKCHPAGYHDQFLVSSDLFLSRPLLVNLPFRSNRLPASTSDNPSSQGSRGGSRPKRGIPRREPDDKVHDSLIEERIQRERPCRTLFIRNIKASIQSMYHFI